MNTKNQLGISNILSVGNDLFDIIEAVVDVTEDGKVTIWEYPKLAGALSGNGFTIVQSISEAIKESSDLTKAERQEIRQLLTARGMEIFEFGNKQGEYGTDGIQQGLKRLLNIVGIIKNAVSDGIGVDDISIVPQIASSIVGLIEDVGQMAREFTDIQIGEGAILIGFMVNEILDMLDGEAVIAKMINK